VQTQVLSYDYLFSGMEELEEEAASDKETDTASEEGIQQEVAQGGASQSQEQRKKHIHTFFGRKGYQVSCAEILLLTVAWSSEKGCQLEARRVEIARKFVRSAARVPAKTPPSAACCERMTILSLSLEVAFLWLVVR
jgi:hypothetical protein